ncbi:MAG: hypothetical protein HYW45_03220 [Candidatus Daviesbacteria bacterium]|nr:MAG: hypothetical protein HYW45_03220 [Candidatus Daviesbacteria bacterium]
MVEPFNGDLSLINRQDLAPMNIGTSLQKERPVLKETIGVVPIWLGLRELDDRDDHELDQRNDLAGFHRELTRSRRFGLYPSFEFPTAEMMEDDNPDFQQANRDFFTFLNETKDRPLAVFVVASEKIAKRPWFLSMGQTISDWRRKLNASDAFTYKIILGRSFDFYKEGRTDPDGHFSKSSMRAADFGAVYLPYNHDHPSVSLRRLVEYMNRVMGCDLPGREFPGYSFEDLRKMADHINQEDFNAWGPREGAIPKYPIVNGRPQFAF